VYQIVSGAEVVAAHGTRDMPIWGEYYRGEAKPLGSEDVLAINQWAQGRILALVYYVGTLQTKK
jgi:hypothetical protein